MSDRVRGHLLAFGTVVVWGVTFVSSKRLLEVMAPEQLLLARMTLGYLLLWVLHPHVLVLKDRRDAGDFFGAGFFGVFLYYLLENVSLTYTYAGNASVIVSTAPFFTVLVCSLAFHERIRGTYVAGFLFAILGIVLITLDTQRLHLDPKGDLVAFGAAAMWGVYSLCTTRITRKAYPVIPATRAMFLVAMVCLVPVNLALAHPWHPLPLPLVGHLLFLGLVASGLSFVSWNTSVKLIGPYVSSFYIYLSPVVTIIASALALGERVTLLKLAGTVLVLVGLAVGERGK